MSDRITSNEETNQQEPLFCDRCLKILHPGRGEYFEVSIRAVADPSPPDLDAYELSHPNSEKGESLGELVRQLDDVSAQEAMDEVVRHLQLTLCNDCYRVWIESPTGD